MISFDDSNLITKLNEPLSPLPLRATETDKTLFVLRGGGSLHKDGTTGEGSGGARKGAGRKKEFRTESDTSPPQSVLDFEDKFATAKFENLAAFTPTGDKLFQTTGTEDNVSVPVEFRDGSGAEKLRGAIMTHNHPSGGLRGFSIEDVLASLASDASEIRAVDDLYLHRFVYPKGVNATPSSYFKFRNGAEDLFYSLEKSLYEKFEPRVQRREMTPEDADDELARLEFETIARELGGTFERTTRLRRAGH